TVSVGGSWFVVGDGRRRRRNSSARGGGVSRARGRARGVLVACSEPPARYLQRPAQPVYARSGFCSGDPSRLDPLGAVFAAFALSRHFSLRTAVRIAGTGRIVALDLVARTIRLRATRVRKPRMYSGRFDDIGARNGVSCVSTRLARLL